MKSFIKSLRTKFLAPVTEALTRLENHQKDSVMDKYMTNDSTSQILLKQHYRMLAKNDISKINFRDIGFRAYSQNKEDGILLFLFSVIGTTNKYCVEICAGDGIQSNSANLIINHGWNGLLFDGDQAAVKRGEVFFRKHPDTFSFPPKFVHAWITRDNINTLIAEHGVKGEIDLLTLDIDGVDYWVWEAIDVISPRVVVAEIQCIWGDERSVTVPYADDFKTQYVNGFGVYSGASLPAFVSLAKRKGYRLVGVEEYGFNAFFMRNDVGADVFPEAAIETCVNLPFVTWAKKEFLHLVKDKPWVEV